MCGVFLISTDKKTSRGKQHSYLIKKTRKRRHTLISCFTKLGLLELPSVLPLLPVEGEEKNYASNLNCHLNRNFRKLYYVNYLEIRIGQSRRYEKTKSFYNGFVTMLSLQYFRCSSFLFSFRLYLQSHRIGPWSRTSKPMKSIISCTNFL